MSTKRLSLFDPPPKELLTRKEAAEFLGVKIGTLSVWACNKRYNLPYCKVGSLVRYRRADLEHFLEAEPSMLDGNFSLGNCEVGCKINYKLLEVLLCPDRF